MVQFIRVRILEWLRVFLKDLKNLFITFKSLKRNEKTSVYLE